LQSLKRSKQEVGRKGAARSQSLWHRLEPLVRLYRPSLERRAPKRDLIPSTAPCPLPNMSETPLIPRALVPKIEVQLSERNTPGLNQISRM